MIGMASERRRVAIIGAGAAGLCCARHFARDLDSAYHVKVFEKGSEVGGTWIYSSAADGHTHSSIYKNLRTNRPKEIMRFPDFPFPSHLPSFVGHYDVLLYLQAYAKHFDVHSPVHFHTEVVEVKPLPSYGSSGLGRSGNGAVSEDVGSFEEVAKWRVQTRNVQSGEETSEEFDNVLVCNGHYTEEYVPEFPGFSGFPGRVIHSHRYRDPEEFTDQNVLVIGAGPSGSDIVLDLSLFCKIAYLSNHGAPLATPLPVNVIQVPRILSARSDGHVEFTDGSVVKVDSVIFATGYCYKFPFLDKECGVEVSKDNRIKPLYKHTFNSSHPSMAFVGVNVGLNTFPIFDYQVRWILSVWDGKKSLPSREKMLEDEELMYQENLQRGISARKAGHYLGSWQWKLLSTFTDLGGNEPLSPVYQKIYEAVSKERKENLMGYKYINYQVLGNDEWDYLRPTDQAKSNLN